MSGRERQLESDGEQGWARTGASQRMGDATGAQRALITANGNSVGRSSQGRHDQDQLPNQALESRA